MSIRPLLSDKECIEATLASGAKATSDAANYEFDDAMPYAKIAVHTFTVPLLLRINAGTGIEASASSFEMAITVGGTFDLSEGGRRTVKEVSVFCHGTIGSMDWEVWGLPV